MSRLRPVVVLAALAALSGCLPTATLEHRPEESRLCRTVDARGWNGAGASWTRSFDDGDHASFDWSDAGSSQDIPGPIEGVYWVQFHASASGSTPDAPRPIASFDPATAVLAIGGRQVHALPRLWAADMVKGYYTPTSELPVPGRLSAGSLMSRNFFLAFPVPAPRARDTWRIDGGTMTIGGKVVALPVAESCFTPSRTWWAPIY